MALHRKERLGVADMHYYNIGVNMASQLASRASEGKMRAMKNRQRSLDEFIIEAVADDYENFEWIFEQVTKWTAGTGLHSNRQQLIDSLERAIREVMHWPIRYHHENRILR